MNIPPELRLRIYEFFDIGKIELVYDKYAKRPQTVRNHGLDTSIYMLVQVCKKLYQEMSPMIPQNLTLTVQLDANGNLMAAEDYQFLARFAPYVTNVEYLCISMNIQPDTTSITSYVYLLRIAEALHNNCDIHIIECNLTLDKEEKRRYSLSDPNPAIELRRDLRKITDCMIPYVNDSVEDAWEEEPLSMAKLLFWRTVEATIKQGDAPHESDGAALRAKLRRTDIIEEDAETEAADEGDESEKDV